MSKSIEEIIKVLETERTCVERQSGRGCDRDCGRCDLVLDDKAILQAYDTAVALLKTHPEAQPNEPLTLKELREMEGQPVYCQFGDGTEGWAVVELEKYPDSTPPTLFLYSFNMENSGHWEPDTDFLNLEDSGVFSSDSHFGLHCLGWRAYRRPPEEETT